MALDADDIKKIGEMIGEHAKNSEPERLKALEAVVGRALGALKLDDKITALKAEIEGKIKPEPDAKEPDAKASAIADDPAFKRLQAGLEAATKAAEEQKKRAEAAEQASKRERLSAGVRDALTSAGADPKRVQIALTHLEASGAVTLDDKGAPAFKFRRDGGYDDVVDAAKGAAEWLKTQDGQFFLPPSGAKGTGDGAGDTRGAGGGGGGGGERSAMDVLRNVLGSVGG